MTGHSGVVPVRSLGAPRLTVGLDDGVPTVGIDAHLTLHGPLPITSRPALTRELLASGLRGRGGAGFPLGRKLEGLAKRRTPVVVVNASEGEPLSRKDAVLLERLPHLVIDGAQAVAEAVGAEEVLVYLHEGRPEAEAAMAAAIAERRMDPVPISVVPGPSRYVAGEASAAVSFLSGGPAVPTRKPPQPTEKGVRGRPTVISNAETFAHVALIVRHGADWFRSIGVESDPGTLLLTISDGTTHFVVEAPTGAAMTDAITSVGGSLERCSAVLLGGYAGTWASPEDVAAMTLDRDALQRVGQSLGVGQVALLPEDGCYLRETASIAGWLAGETAGQCGPCEHGLPDIAGAMDALSSLGATRSTAQQVMRWADMVDGRGACAHPNGVARLVRSAVSHSPDHLAAHRRGSCHSARTLFPIPQQRVSA